MDLYCRLTAAPPGGPRRARGGPQKPGLALNGRHQYGGNVVCWCIPVVTSAAAARLVVTTGVSGKTNAITPAAPVLNIAVIPAAGERSSRLIPNRLLSDESAPCVTCLTYYMKEPARLPQVSMKTDGFVQPPALKEEKNKMREKKKIESTWLLYTQLNNACDESVVGERGRGKKMGW